MKTWMLLLTALLVATGCQADTAKLATKDDITKLERKLDAVLAQGGRPGAAGQQRPQRPEPDRAKTYAVPIENDFFEGPADAKITMVKAYEYACPFCQRVLPTLKQLQEKYGNDIRIVSKHLVVHPNTATSTALAFCAAMRQGKAKEMDNLLWEKTFNGRAFDADKCWEGDAGCPNMIGHAQALQLDVNKFKADMKACMPIVQADMRSLQQFGVGATPSFFINGRFISGAVPVDNFITVIDEELKKANERIQQGTPKAQYYQQWVIDKGLKSLEPPKQ
jgi:protein-disulfide isomerase